MPSLVFLRCLSTPSPFRWCLSTPSLLSHPVVVLNTIPARCWGGCQHHPGLCGIRQHHPPRMLLTYPTSSETVKMGERTLRLPQNEKPRTRNPRKRISKKVPFWCTIALECTISRKTLFQLGGVEKHRAYSTLLVVAGDLDSSGIEHHSGRAHQPCWFFVITVAVGLEVGVCLWSG